MMKVSSKISLNMPVIRQLSNAAVIALEQTAESLHTEVIQEQVMPRDTGALQNESTFVDASRSREGIVSLISSTPYARRLYFHPEYKFYKGENPNAGGQWYQPWIDGKYENFCRESFANIYRRLTGL